MNYRYPRRLMRAIAQELTSRTGDAFVLKGGTALLLAYDLPRFSIDLDFDLTCDTLVPWGL